MKVGTFEAFDYLGVVFLNVGYFLAKRRGRARQGSQPPEFYTFLVNFIREYQKAASSWEKVRTRGLDVSPYRDDFGFEQVARDLGIDYPEKPDEADA